MFTTFGLASVGHVPGSTRPGHRAAVTPSACPGRLADLLGLLGVEPEDSESGAATAIALWNVREGAALIREGAQALGLYVVRTGTFKNLKTSEDGYEQVLGFASPGDVLGFEGLYGQREPLSAVALEDCSVYGLPLCELSAMRLGHPTLDHALQRALSRQLARVALISEVMAAVAAEVRLARFLSWQSASASERGLSPRRLMLRMSRRDIASLLGVAHETVSRAFGTLADAGLLRVDNREIEILDAEGLKSCARNTRRSAEETPSRGVGFAACARPHWAAA